MGAYRQQSHMLLALQIAADGYPGLCCSARILKCYERPLLTWAGGMQTSEGRSNP